MCNVATQQGETAGFDLADHIEALERHTATGIVDVVLANNQFRARTPAAWGAESGPACAGRRPAPQCRAWCSMTWSTRRTPTTTIRPDSRRRCWAWPNAKAAPAVGHRSSARRERLQFVRLVQLVRAGGSRTGCGWLRPTGTSSRQFARSLASIDPARPCDRAAEAIALFGGSRSASGLARLAIRLGRPGADSSFDWAGAAEHCRLAWLRGLYLSRASLSLAGGRTHLEFVVPADDAPLLAARLAELELPASWRVRRGLGVVTWKNGEVVGTFLRRIGAGAACSSSRRGRSGGRCAAISTA